MINIPYDNALDTAKLSPSRLNAEGRDGGSFGRSLEIGKQLSPSISAGVWMAEPGVYRHPGGPNGETFVVLQGLASIEIEAGDTYRLEPGSIISVPPTAASIMRVEQTLLKVSMIAKHI